MSDEFVLRVSTSPVMSWIIRHISSHLDPLLFRASNGRFTSMGVPSMPMLTLTARGRKSGKRRAVHLACLEDDGSFLVVASAMGQARHPAWSLNLDAKPDVEVQVRGRRFSGVAKVLEPSEKESVWPRVHRAIPQMKVYESRTDRAIKVYRLTPREA
ncbi:MAG: nitroreductase/quinone reductase family protein [Myxococcota bacterium]|jgi:deazaflavin-dependent oxidoreductase (nitroreductase family)|nr:nitroreductase/quinone reductase family protein [Myxococcota bacterium]